MGKGAVREDCPFRLAFYLGAGNRSRTYDLRITNALLYQLSYAGEAMHSSTIFCRVSKVGNERKRAPRVEVFLLDLRTFEK